MAPVDVSGPHLGELLQEGQIPCQPPLRDLERQEHELVILIEHERLGMILEVEVPLAFRVAHAALPRCRRGMWRVAAERSNNSRALSLSVKLSAVKLAFTSA